MSTAPSTMADPVALLCCVSACPAERLIMIEFLMAPVVYSASVLFRALFMSLSLTSDSRSAQKHSDRENSASVPGCRQGWTGGDWQARQLPV